MAFNSKHRKPSKSRRYILGGAVLSFSADYMSKEWQQQLRHQMKRVNLDDVSMEHKYLTRTTTTTATQSRRQKIEDKNERKTNKTYKKLERRQTGRKEISKKKEDDHRNKAGGTIGKDKDKDKDVVVVKVNKNKKHDYSPGRIKLYQHGYITLDELQRPSRKSRKAFGKLVAADQKLSQTVEASPNEMERNIVLTSPSRVVETTTNRRNNNSDNDSEQRWSAAVSSDGAAEESDYEESVNKATTGKCKHKTDATDDDA